MIIDSNSKTPSTYDKFRYPNSPFHKIKYEKSFSIIGKGRKNIVLEVGCGTGVYTKFLSKDYDRLISIDIDSRMVRIAKCKFNGINYCIADSLNLPVKNNSTDLVYGISILHHIRDYSRIFKEVKRILKKGGNFIFCEPNKLNPFTYLYQVLLHKEDSISRFEIKRLIKKNGLKVIAIKEILSGTPKSYNILNRFEFYSKIDKLTEELHLGVTLLIIGKK